MARILTLRKGIGSVVFWSVISAAFIGPGTVTTASKSGATYGYTLLWALLFSTLATIVLQEAGARITIASGRSLGEVLSTIFGGPRGRQIKILLFSLVAFGCSAYQTGNILGAYAGFSLALHFPPGLFMLGVGTFCALLLWKGDFQLIARLMGLVVALMGLAFFIVAFRMEHDFSALVSGLFLPSVPSGSSILVIGLVGTTVVPYNLFLATGLSQGQDLREMRLGVILAVSIGGVISMAILAAATQVHGDFSFSAIGEALAAFLGPGAAFLFYSGLAFAGITSAITAPFAAAVTGKALFGAEHPKQWSVDGKHFRITWAVVLSVGLIFGFLGIRPVPAIILAQALNGILLPLVVIFLAIAVNDVSLLGPSFRNGKWSNIALLFVVFIAAFLGFWHLSQALTRLVGMEADQQSGSLLTGSLLLAVLLTGATLNRVIRQRKQPIR